MQAPHFLDPGFPVELTNHIVAFAGPKAALNVRRVNREGRSRMDALFPSAQSGLALVIRRADPPTPEGWPPAVRAHIVVDNMGEAELQRLFRNLPPTVRFLAVRGSGHSLLPDTAGTPNWQKLQKLTVAVPGLRAPPRGLHRLTSLVALDIGELALPVRPENIGEFRFSFGNLPPHIQSLALSYSSQQLSASLPDIPDTPAWRQLRTLTLRIAENAGLPSGLHLLTSLETLAIEGLRLAAPNVALLRQMFGSLPPHLQSLSLGFSSQPESAMLPGIPATPAWRQLRSLSLDVLGVLALPGLRHLSALEELSVNGLEGEFPGEVLSLGNLRVLSLKESSIEALPHGLYRSLPKLEEFDFEGTAIEYPDDLWRLPKLKSLALEIIVEGAWRLPANLGRMQTLEALRLGWGELHIPAGSLPAGLRTLVMEGCLINDLPADFANLPHLHTLELVYTDIRSLEGVLQLPALRNLAVSPETIMRCWRAWKKNPTYPFAKALAQLASGWAAQCIAEAAREMDTEEFMEFCLGLLAPKASYKQVMGILASDVPYGADEKVTELYRHMGDPGIPPAPGVSPAMSPGVSPAMSPGVSPGVSPGY